MSETPPPHDKDEIPEDPIEYITRELREREARRRKAVDMGWEMVDNAETEVERLRALSNVARMMDMLEEFHHIFPETFPESNEQ